MNVLSRRCFLTQAALCSGAMAGASVLGTPRLAAVEPLQRPGRARFQLSLAAYSFRDSFNATDPARRITLFDFVDFCADHGCTGTELTSYYFPKDLTDAFLLRLKRHVFLRGLAVSGTAVGNNFALPLGDARDREIAQTRRWIDHAAVLGAPHIRVFAGDPKGGELAPAKRRCIEALETTADYAGSKGIFLGLENHGGIVADVADLLEIVRAVKSPWLGVNLDSGNFYSDADPYDEMARLAPYAVNVQIKVEVNRRGRGKEPTDLTRVTRVLREANYQGFVALEYEAAPDPWKAVPEWLERMRAALAA